MWIHDFRNRTAVFRKHGLPGVEGERAGFSSNWTETGLAAFGQNCTTL